MLRFSARDSDQPLKFVLSSVSDLFKYHVRVISREVRIKDDRESVSFFTCVIKYS